MNQSFFNSLNYAAAHEDGRSELRALRPGPGDRVICITGSGARPLDMLLGDPTEVIAVDINPAQNALLELKIAAIQHFSHADCLGFLGVLPSRSRADAYQALRPSLSDVAKRYWDNHAKALDRGVLYCGRWERMLRLFSRTFSLLRSRERERLFGCRTFEEQALAWARWDDAVWRGFIRCIANQSLWRAIGHEPGAFLISPETDVAGYILDRFARAARRILFRDSAWARLVFFGRYSGSDALPLHLRPENHAVLASRAKRIRIVTSTLTDAMADLGPDAIDAFSISDVSSYLTAQQHQDTWSALLRSARPGGRVCERRFLVRYPTQWAESRGLRRDLELERRLDLEDDSVVYDFVAGVVEK